jgi:hypothetical protein
MMILVILSMVSAMGLGSIFTKSFSGRLVLGLSFAALVAGPFIFINIQMVRPLQLILFVIGCLLHIKKLTEYFRKQSNFKDNIKVEKGVVIRVISQLLMAGFFLYLILNQYSKEKYVYESHDVLYFGWISEIWNAGYSGKIRVPTMWPLEMSSMNTMTSVVLGQLNVLRESPNLAEIIEIRYVFLILIFCLFLFENVMTNWKKMFSVALCAFVPFLLFYREISYSIGMSSLWYLILLIAICREVIFDENKSNVELLIVYFSILTIAKGQLFIISLMCIVYLFWNSKGKSFSKSTILIVLLSGINFLQILFLPRAEGARLGIPLPFGIKPYFANNSIHINWLEVLSSSNGIVDWYMGPEKNGIVQLPIALETKALLILFLIAIKVYFLYWISRHFMFRRKIYFTVLDLYMILSFLSVVIIRNGGHIGHQAHAYLLACTVTFIYVSIATEKSVSRAKMPLIVVFIMLVTRLPFSILPYKGENLDKLRNYANSSLRLNTEYSQININNGAQLEVWYALRGARIKYDPKRDYSFSQVVKFTINSKPFELKSREEK